MTKLDTLVNRLSNIGIDIELISNVPWIYINKVNGKKVTEKFHAEHGFTVAFLTMKGDIKFTCIPEIFKIIRKYI